MKINTELLKQELTKVLDKLYVIDAIPRLYGTGDSSVGIAIEDDEIVYKTETYVSGCGTDTFSLSIKWDELNNPIEFFKEKFAEEIKEYNRLKLEKEEEARQFKDQENYKIYLSVKSKLEQS